VERGDELLMAVPGAGSNATLTTTGNWTNAAAGVGCPRVITVECLGGGAAGGAGTSSSGGGQGGGAGAYSKKTGIAVTPGQVIAFVIGAAGVGNNTGNGGDGGNTTWNTNVCVAAGGDGGKNYGGAGTGAGGAEADCIGDASSQGKGGDGGAGGANLGGGGGESGWNVGDGNAGTAGTGTGAGGTGTNGFDGGAGAQAAHDDGSPPAAGNYGGGGGGAGHMSGGAEYGGGGRQGVIYVTYTTTDAAPTVNLDTDNTPADAGTVSTTTPILKFKGTDANSDEVEYKVEVDTAVTFDGQSGAFSLKYVDIDLATVASPTDNLTLEVRSTSITGTVLGTSDSVPYTSVPSSHDYVRFTFATPVALAASTKYYLRLTRSGADGSNRYSSGVSTVSSYADGGYYSNDGGESGTVDWRFVVYDTNTTAVITQNAWSQPYALNGTTVMSQGQSFTTLGVHPLIRALSVTPDAGFANPADGADGHPWASGTTVQYTVQTALTNGLTYYWRVAGMDPSGTVTYGAWSDTHSFVVSTLAFPPLFQPFHNVLLRR
jgi:hypothetical protein